MTATLLRVNRSNGTIGREPVADAITRQFTGGPGGATMRGPAGTLSCMNTVGMLPAPEKRAQLGLP